MTESCIAVAFARLRAFTAAAFERLGLSAADAYTVATLMAEAEAPVVLDTATTVAAYGKVKIKARRGLDWPEVE